VLPVSLLTLVLAVSSGTSHPGPAVDGLACSANAAEAIRNLEPEQWDEPDARAGIQRVLMSPSTPQDDQLQIAWTAAYLGRFSVIREQVETLMAASRNEANTRELAYVYVFGIDDRFALQPSDDLVRFFRSSSGSLRAEAAIEIAAHSQASLADGVEREVIDTLTAQMLDSRVPAIDRDRAIEAAQFFATDDLPLSQTLLMLSQPDHWFDGAQGAHHFQSSIVDVIYALGERQATPAVAQRLKTLPDDIATKLSEFNRWLATVALEIVRKRTAG